MTKGICRISAFAERSASARAGNPELLHLGLEGGPFHAELYRCTRGPTDDPARLTQGPENMLALGLFEGDRRGILHVDQRRFQFSQRHVEIRSLRQDDGASMKFSSSRTLPGQK